MSHVYAAISEDNLLHHVSTTLKSEQKDAYGSLQYNAMIDEEYLYTVADSLKAYNKSPDNKKHLFDKPVKDYIARLSNRMNFVVYADKVFYPNVKNKIQSSISYIIAPMGSGKTHWTVEQIVNNLTTKAYIYLIAVPTCKLAEEVYSDVNSLLESSKLTHMTPNVKHLTSAVINTGILRECEEQFNSASAGDCLIVTHVSMYNILQKCSKKQQAKTRLIMDEAAYIGFKTTNLDFSKGKNNKTLPISDQYLAETTFHNLTRHNVFFKDEKIKKKVEKVGSLNPISNLSSFATLEANATSKKVFKYLKSVSDPRLSTLLDVKNVETILDDIYLGSHDVYVRAISRKGEKTGVTYDATQMRAASGLFAYLGDVVMMSAFFEQSLAYFILHKNYNLVNITPTVFSGSRKDRLQAISKTSQRINVYYLYNRRLTKSLLNSSVHIKNPDAIPILRKFLNKYKDTILDAWNNISVIKGKDLKMVENTSITQTESKAIAYTFQLIEYGIDQATHAALTDSCPKYLRSVIRLKDKLEKKGIAQGNFCVSSTIYLQQLGNSILDPLKQKARKIKKEKKKEKEYKHLVVINSKYDTFYEEGNEVKPNCTISSHSAGSNKLADYNTMMFFSALNCNKRDENMLKTLLPNKEFPITIKTYDVEGHEYEKVAYYSIFADRTLTTAAQCIGRMCTREIEDTRETHTVVFSKEVADGLKSLLTYTIKGVEYSPIVHNVGRIFEDDFVGLKFDLSLAREKTSLENMTTSERKDYRKAYEKRRAPYHAKYYETKKKEKSHIEKTIIKVKGAFATAKTGLSNEGKRIGEQQNAMAVGSKQWGSLGDKKSNIKDQIATIQKNLDYLASLLLKVEKFDNNTKKALYSKWEKEVKKSLGVDVLPENGICKEIRLAQLKKLKFPV